MKEILQLIALIQRLLVSLALGALIGIEREKTQQLQKARDIAGIRTFMLISLMGSLSVYLSEFFTEWFAIVSLICFTLFFLMAYYFRYVTRKEVGLTTEFSAIVTYFIGIIAFCSKIEHAISVTIFVALILSFRIFLHQMVRKLNRKEFYDTLKFLIVAFVILPLLPNRFFGPLDAFNPYETWLIVVLVSGIGFLGYLLLKYVNSRHGIELTGLIGGIVASTPLVLTMASKSRSDEKSSIHYVYASVLSNSTMFFRILIIVFIITGHVSTPLLLSMALMSLVGIIWTIFFWKKKEQIGTKIDFKSPFTLGPAISFAVLYAAIIFLSKHAVTFLGASGIFATSILSGFANIDAIAITLSKLAQTGLDNKLVAIALCLAACSNTLVKIFISYFFGSKEFFRKIIGVFSMTFIVGAATALLVYFYM
ncbi:MAG: MgtC/SapB family protein [archaeon]